MDQGTNQNVNQGTNAAPVNDHINNAVYKGIFCLLGHNRTVPFPIIETHTEGGNSMQTSLTVHSRQQRRERTHARIKSSLLQLMSEKSFEDITVTELAQEAGINTALESMGHAQYSAIEQILPYLDQYLLDIKHMNPEKHEAFTGKRNELMLENARRIADSGMTELSIRVPVVPGFNDTPEEIGAIAAYTRSLKNVRRMHLLPYHRLGQDKYKGLGRPYLMGDVEPPTNEKMEMLLRMAVEISGVECQIGG